MTDGMGLTKEERVGEIVALRTKIKSNLSLRLQILASVSDLLHKHGITVEDEILADLTITIPDEVSSEMAGVVLPGGTNCR